MRTERKSGREKTETKMTKDRKLNQQTAEIRRILEYKREYGSRSKVRWTRKEKRKQEEWLWHQ
jgi:hypothetical protein